MSALGRQIQILFVLSRRRFETIANLAHEFGVCYRTIHRDISFLSGEHFPLYMEKGNGGGVRVDKDWHFGGFLSKDDETFLIEQLPNIPDDNKLRFLTIIHAYSKPNSHKAVLR